MKMMLRLAVAVLTAFVGSAVLLADSGYNMYLDAGYAADTSQTHHLIYYFEGVYGCSGGCGYTNVEVSWDDGTYTSFSGNWNDANMQYRELSHYFPSNGLYHVTLSADDNLGNWVSRTSDIWVTW